MTAAAPPHPFGCGNPRSRSGLAFGRVLLAVAFRFGSSVEQRVALDFALDIGREIEI